MNMDGSAPKGAFSADDFLAPNIRRLCDIVMKGGITSGVVYPLAICKLATERPVCVHSFSISTDVANG